MHFFLQLTMQEGIFYVQLVKRPMLNGNHSKKEMHKCNFGHRGKGVLVVKTGNLSVSFAHQVNLIVINTSIWFDLHSINSTTTQNGLASR